MSWKGIALTAVLFIAGIGIGYAFSHEERQRLQSEIGELELQVSVLTTDYGTLNSTYGQLRDNYTNLNNYLDELLERPLNLTYSELLDAYEMINDAYSQLVVDYINLNGSHADLQTDLEEAETRITELEQMISEIYVLTNQEYYETVKDDLENANATVLVAMYSMIYDPDDSLDWANDLVRELVQAKDRGVNVTVIIEYRTYWDYMSENLEAYNYLSANGVSVQLDEDTETDHMKLVVIDDYFTYVGSHNWSESGLYYNSETSVKIVSEDVAEDFSEYFETI